MALWPSSKPIISPGFSQFAVSRGAFAEYHFQSAVNHGALAEYHVCCMSLFLPIRRIGTITTSQIKSLAVIIRGELCFELSQKILLHHARASNCGMFKLF